MLSLTEDTVLRGKVYSCSLNLCASNSSEVAANKKKKIPDWFSVVLYYSFLVQVNDLNIASIIDLSINVHINKKILINITNTGNGVVMTGP